jgi:hypothetical protein
MLEKLGGMQVTLRAEAIDKLTANAPPFAALWVFRTHHAVLEIMPSRISLTV